MELEKAGPSSQTERLKKKMNSYKLAREKLDKELSSEREKNRDLERQVEQLKASLVEADKAHQEEVTKVRAGAEESIQKARAEEAARLAEREEALKKQAVEEFRDSSEYEALMREVQHDLLRAMIKEVQERHPDLDTAFLEPEDEAEVEVDAGQPGDQS